MEHQARPATSAIASERISIEAAFQRGVTLYQHQKKQQAREIFEQILHYAPNNIQTLQVLAVLDMEQGCWKSALEKIEHGLSHEPNNPSLLFDKVQILAQYGFNKEGLAIIETLLIEYPNNSEFLHLKQQLSSALNLKKAHKNTAEKKQPLSKDLDEEINKTLALAMQLKISGNKEQAKQLIQSALAICPTHHLALFAMGKLFFEQKEFAQARQFLLRGWDVDKTDFQVLALLSYSTMKLEDYLETRKLARLGRQLWPTESVFAKLEILTFEHEKKWLEATKLAKQAHEFWVDDPEVLYRYASSNFELLRTRHNFVPEEINFSRTLVEKAQSIVTKKEDKKVLSSILTEILFYQGKIKEAKILLENHTKNYPDDRTSAFNLSFIYQRLKKWDLYYEHYDIGLEIGNRILYTGNHPRWTLERPKTDVVVFIPEQGVGDEILHLHNLNLVINNVKKLYLFCDKRLNNLFKQSFPSIETIPITGGKDRKINITPEIEKELTSWIAGASLAKECFKLTGRNFHQHKYINVDEKLKSKWHDKINAIKSNYPEDTLFIGLCWRSSLGGGHRGLQYLKLKDVVKLVKLMPNAVFINLQYDDCKKELAKIKKLSGISVIRMEELDLKDDFDNTAALISNLDLVITAGTAIHRLTVAVGTPCHVFFCIHEDVDITKPSQPENPLEWVYEYPPQLTDKTVFLHTIKESVLKNHAKKTPD